MVFGRIANGRSVALAGGMVALALAACGGDKGNEGGDAGAGNGAGGSSGGPATNDYVARLELNTPDLCLPRALPAEEDGSIPCHILEASSAGSGDCSCDARDRLTPNARTSTAASKFLQAQSICGTEASPACAEFCLCEIEQFSGNELVACRTEPAASPSGAGYCYVEGESELTQFCSQSEKRRLRFLGDDVPAQDAVLLLTCAATSVD